MIENKEPDDGLKTSVQLAIIIITSLFILAGSFIYDLSQTNASNFDDGKLYDRKYYDFHASISDYADIKLEAENLRHESIYHKTTSPLDFELGTAYHGEPIVFRLIEAYILETDVLTTFQGVDRVGSIIRLDFSVEGDTGSLVYLEETRLIELPIVNRTYSIINVDQMFSEDRVYSEFFYVPQFAKEKITSLSGYYYRQDTNQTTSEIVPLYLEF